MMEERKRDDSNMTEKRRSDKLERDGEGASKHIYYYYYIPSI